MKATLKIRKSRFTYFFIFLTLLLEFLNVYESFTLVLPKITRHRTPSTERRRDAVVNPCSFSYAQLCLSKDEGAVR